MSTKKISFKNALARFTARLKELLDEIRLARAIPGFDLPHSVLVCARAANMVALDMREDHVEASAMRLAYIASQCEEELSRLKMAEKRFLTRRNMLMEILDRVVVLPDSLARPVAILHMAYSAIVRNGTSLEELRSGFVELTNATRKAESTYERRLVALETQAIAA